MKTKMNLRWRWLLGLSLMLCWLGGSGPDAVQAQESVRTAADKDKMVAMATMVAPTSATAAQGKVVASMPTADLPTVKVAQYRRGRKSALRDTVRFTAVWAAGPEDEYPMQMLLAGEGEGVIDWGDGTQTSCSAVKNEAGTDYTYKYYGHIYTDEADGDAREITVYTTSPDLQIIGLQLYYYTNYDIITLHSGVDVSACPSLKYLSCGFNWLGALDLTRNTALEEVNVTRCRLTSLALPQSAALKLLACGGNRLTSLDVSGCPALRQLYCWGNQLTELNLSQNTVLDTLECTSNQLGWATLDALSQLGCSYLVIAPQNLSFEVGLNEAVDLSGYMTYKGQQTVCDFSAMPASAYTFNNSILKINRAGAFTVSMSNPAVKRNGEALPINCNVSVVSGVSDTVRWVWQQNGGIDYVNLTIAGNATSITMDWGDGTIETEAVNANGFRQIRHIYATAGEYTVKIWGDNQWMLSGLELFSHSHVQSLDLSDCPYLESLVCSGNDLTALDLSACLSLRILNCANNKLTSLDLSKNLNLQQMSCAQNQLTSLSIGRNTAMRYLYCYNNQLTSLDVTQNTNLIMLDAANNQLTSLDVSANGKLQGLYCNGNQLTSLNVAQNTDLTHLYCWNNQLTSLNVRTLTKLRYLSCSYNQLTALDLSQNSSLKLLYAGYNRLTSLDATNNPLLDTLECQSNQLTSLNVNPSTRFKVLNGSYNQLGWAALAALTALEGEDIMLSPQALPSLEVSLNDAVDFSAYATYNGQQTVFAVTPEEGYTLNNGIVRIQNVGHYTVNMSNPGVTFKGAPVIISRSLTVWPAASDTLRWVVLDSTAMISYLNAICDASFIVDWGDGQKETVTVSGQSYSGYNIKHSYGTKGEYAVTVYGLGHFMLLHLNLGSNVQSLDVRTCPFLEFLECEGHQLTELDLSKNTALTALNVSGNRLTSLNLTQNTGLTQLYCGANQLSSLDVSKHAALKDLYCNGNQLTSLDVSKNTALTDLYCYGNQLTSLDVSKNTALVYLACDGNQLLSLDLSKNTALTYLACGGNQLSSLDVSKNTALRNLYCSNNQLASLVLTHNTDLRDLYCNNNQLTSLDLSACSSLEVLQCGVNQLTSLNMPQTMTFQYFSCEYNRLGWADLDALSEIAVNNNFFISPQYLPLEAGLNEDAIPAEYLTYNGQQTEFHFEDHLSSYYTLENGNVQFNSFGAYSFSMTNPAVQSQNDMPIDIAVLVSVWPAAPDTVRWVWQTDGGIAYVNLEMSHDEGFIIDWGDGTVEKQDGWYQFSHTYAEAGEYAVTAYGVNRWLLSALEFRGGAQVKSLDVSACPYLVSLSCNGGLASLDVSKNTALTSLYCSNSQLTSLDLSKNTALAFLGCPNNQLTSLDLSENAALTYLNCSNNQLTSLDLSKNTALTSLGCSNNQLTSLDVSKNTALQNLYCSNNQLTSLDLSKNTALTDLECYVNGLTSLDLSKNTALTHLNCYNNQLTSLDLSENTALTSLHCFNNQLTSLDLPGNTALTSLNCFNNQLTSLDVSGNTALTSLDCSYNQLTSMDLSENTALTSLHCFNNQLTSLDVSENTALTHLNCSNNQLTSLDLSKNTALTSLDCSGNVRRVDLDEDRTFDLSTLPGMDVSRVSNVEGAIWLNPQMIFRSEIVTYDYATGSGTVAFRLEEAIVRDTVYMTWTAEAGQEKFLTVGIGEESEGDPYWVDFGDGTYYRVGVWESPSINLSHTYETAGTYTVKVSLTSDAREAHILTFSCDGLSRTTGNGVTSLDVSACTALETLSCNNNNLTTLDLSKNTALTSLSCNNNPALVLDLSQVPSLTSLSCNGNRLSSLNVSQLPDLVDLWCADNQLTSLNLSQNTALRNLYCYNNKLSSLSLSSNRWLKVLSCSFNQLTSLNLSQNTKLEILNCSDNQLTDLDLSKNTALRILSCDNNQLVSLDLTANKSLSTSCQGNYRVVRLDTERRFDLSTLPGVDVARVRNVKGAFKSGSILTFNTGVNKATYEYATRIYTYDGDDEEYYTDYQTFSIGTLALTPDDPGTAPRDTIYMTVDIRNSYYKTISFGIEVSVPENWTSGRNTVWVDWGNGFRSYSSEKSGTFASSFPEESVYEVMVSVASPDVHLTKLLCTNNRNGALLSLDVSACPSLERLECSWVEPKLTISNNPALKYISCYQNGNIQSLDLRSCVALEELYCSGSTLWDLYLPNSPALKKLRCDCPLNSLDVSHNPGLIELDCSTCNLRSLDLTHNPVLKKVDCSRMESLRSLDVRGCTVLEVLACYDNALTELDLTQNKALKSLQCNKNRLTSLDVSGCDKLQSLTCHDNRLTSLNISDCSDLRHLACNNNRLTSLNLSDCLYLKSLNCDNNNLTTLDVSKNSDLRGLNCSRNYLTSLDLSKNSMLGENPSWEEDDEYWYDDWNVYCENNVRTVGLDANRGFDLSTLPGMDASRVSNVSGGFKAGSRLYFDEDADEVTYNYNTKHAGNYKTVSFRLIAASVFYDTVYLTWTAEAGAEKTLQVGVSADENWLPTDPETVWVDWGDGSRSSSQSMADAFTKTYTEAGTYAVKVWANSQARLSSFGCSGNGVTALDVNACTDLVSLTCDNNQLTSLDMSGNTKLETLYCQNNQLKTLDVGTCTDLASLTCDTNQLTALDLSGNMKLKALYCRNNQLTALDMGGNTELEILYCQNNRLTFNVISAIPVYDAFGMIEGRLSPQCDFYDTITLEEGFPLPERMSIGGEVTNIIVLSSDGSWWVENNAYTIRDGLLFFDKAGTYKLEVYNDRVGCLEANFTWDCYFEYTYLTVKGEDEPDPIVPDPENYDLAVWTWTKADNEAWATSVTFAGTEGGTFVIDWGDGEKETVEGTGVSIYYNHTYGEANPVGPTDTSTRSGKKGLIEWRLYATTPESRILKLQKGSDVGLANETLDVSGCPELTYLGWVGCEGCGGGLTALDVSRNVKLEKLYCYDNRLTSLDVTQNTALTLLACYRNQLTSLDVTKNTKLGVLYCFENQLTSLDVTKNVALTEFGCSSNRLTSLDITRNTALTWFNCSENPLKVLDVTKNVNLTSLQCLTNQLTSLDVTKNTALTKLNCAYNPLTALDVAKNTALKELYCYGNQLTSLNLTKNLMLETLYCHDNRLETLDVSQNTALTALGCSRNRLTSLDVSDCMALEVLLCNDNQLTSLDLTQNTKLVTLTCEFNYLPLSVLATFKDVTSTSLSPQHIVRETQPGKVLDLRSEMRIGATQTVYTVLKDGKPVDSTAYTMNADGVYGQLRFKTSGQYRLTLSNAEVAETFTRDTVEKDEYWPNEKPQPAYVYYDISVDQPIVQGSGAGWMWLASAGAEKQITFEGSAEGFRIDWGDETASDVESGLATHRYAEGGIYTVKIESLSNDGRLTSLDVSNGNVAMIWFEDASKLTSLNCADNQLTSVDLSVMPNLTDYNCARNQFSALDLTALPQLQTVDFSGNQLTAVSLPTHANLKAVKGADNRMKLSTLYDLLSQRAEKASYGFDPQGDSVYVPAGNILDLSAEMNIGGNNTTYVVSDAEGRPVQTSDYTETNGSFRFTEAGHRYKVILMNMSVMEYQNGNPQKPVTFVLNVIVPGVGNEELTGSDACVYVRNRTICLSEDLGEMRVYTTLGRCIYKGNGLEAEVPCAGLYVVQAGGHTWKVVVR